VTGRVGLDMDEHLRGLLEVHALDPRPALLYFHYDHEGDAAKSPLGKASRRQCNVLDDEQVARWSYLYRCLEVDVVGSEAALLERFGAGKGPSFAVVDGGLEVVARSEALGDSKQMAAFLRTTLAGKLPAYWAEVEGQLAVQREALAEARRLEKQRRYRDALEQYELVSRSQLRVGDFWDTALEATRDVEKKAGERE
jgi:hypothetical protein